MEPAGPGCIFRRGELMRIFREMSDRLKEITEIISKRQTQILEFTCETQSVSYIIFFNSNFKIKSRVQNVATATIVGRILLQKLFTVNSNISYVLIAITHVGITKIFLIYASQVFLSMVF